MVLNTKRLATAGACALMGALAAVPSAEAAFTLADCQGDSVTGRGASFQQTAQNTWANGFVLTDSFLEPTACDALSGFGGSVGYEPLGSGAGRTAFGGGSSGGVRNPAVRFVGYDEAPSADEQARMEAGTSSTSDDGNLLTIPVASGATTFAADVPNDCQVTGNATNALVEQAFRGSSAVDTWGELFPGAIAGANGKTTAACEGTPITRVARLDSSGTTFQFKAFLDQVNNGDLDPGTVGTQTWRELPTEAKQTEYGNTAWPNQGSNLVRGTVNGAASQVDKLSQTDGGIAYADLAIARTKGYSASGDKRWLSLRNAGGDPRPPTSGTRGSNCSSTTQYNNVPANAEADWSQVYGAIPVSGYPACALTYVGAWEDNADVYGNTATEQAHARTVKDYLEYVMSPTGQGDAIASDYGALPSNVKVIADSGVSQIRWNDDRTFTVSECGGDSIIGRGASFQQTAQSTWAKGFTQTDSYAGPEACDAFTPFVGSVFYEPQGSGAGRTAFGGGSSGGVRSPAIRFVGYDQAPSADEQARMEAGTSSSGDEGNLLTIPVASGAITVLVNVPDDCAISGSPSNALVEQAFRGAGTVDTWGELYAAPASITGTGGKTTAACQATTITRVARKDSAGTTFQFKAFLDQVNNGDLDANTAGVQTWRELPGQTGQTEYSNTAWPNQATNLVRGDANGAASQIDKLSATDGGIAYADLAILRTKGYSASGDKRWFSLQDAYGTFRAPTSGTRGSNCSSTTQYNNVPANAEADWSQVYGAIPVSGYPACALTYVGAWEDNADVYGNTATEQAHARTVKDYLEYVMSPTGQGVAITSDYGALPSNVKAIADGGVSQIGWNK